MSAVKGNLSNRKVRWSGAAFRQVLDERKLNNTEAGVLLRVTPRTIRRWAGGGRPKSEAEVKEIASALNVPVARLRTEINALKRGQGRSSNASGTKGRVATLQRLLGEISDRTNEARQMLELPPGLDDFKPEEARTHVGTRKATKGRRKKGRG